MQARNTSKSLTNVIYVEVMLEEPAQLVMHQRFMNTRVPRIFYPRMYHMTLTRWILHETCELHIRFEVTFGVLVRELHMQIPKAISIIKPPDFCQFTIISREILVRCNKWVGTEYSVGGK